MNNSEIAYFAGGCFWCITPTFKEMPGVARVTAGYSGGDEIAPTYNEVKNQMTHHRETMKIEYDPEKVTFEELFDIFLCGVDPFDGEGQFIDRGRSYTLAVYYTTPEQESICLEKIASLEESSGKRVFISLEPFNAFYDAEEEHQDFYLKNPERYEQELVESGRIVKE